MKSLKRSKFLSQRAQATVEYLLIIVVVITVGFATYERINEAFFDNNGFFDRFFSGTQNVFSSGSNGLELKYKRFRLNR